MNSYSQAAQDRFAFEMNERRTDRAFLDIGCADGRAISNTLGLEELGWRGLLVDIQRHSTIEFRASPFIQGDACVLDWPALLHAFNCIDYLSLDVDESTTRTLQKLLQTPWKYRVITCEHDAYCLGEGPRKIQRELLLGEGYELVCADVCVPKGAGLNGGGGPFEDWWVRPELVSEATIQRFQSSGLLWSEIMQRAFPMDKQQARV